MTRKCIRVSRPRAAQAKLSQREDVIKIWRCLRALQERCMAESGGQSINGDKGTVADSIPGSAESARAEVVQEEPVRALAAWRLCGAEDEAGNVAKWPEGVHPQKNQGTHLSRCVSCLDCINCKERRHQAVSSKTWAPRPAHSEGGEGREAWQTRSFGLRLEGRGSGQQARQRCVLCEESEALRRAHKCPAKTCT